MLSNETLQALYSTSKIVSIIILFTSITIGISVFLGNIITELLKKIKRW